VPALKGVAGVEAAGPA